MENMRKTHGISCSERTATVLTGIEAIEGFDEENIVMKTADMGLSIRGHGLHIDKFDADTGDMICSGTVDAIIYFETKKPSLKKRFAGREK